MNLKFQTLSSNLYNSYRINWNSLDLANKRICKLHSRSSASQYRQ